MASGPPEHHMDRLGRRLGGRSFNLVLAAEERIGSPNLTLLADRVRCELSSEALFAAHWFRA